MTDSLILALALVLVLEGILPFAVPGLWRRTMGRLAMMSNKQVRIVGFVSMMVGLLIALILL
ncbi:hypothetical protein IGB42_01220 [Andreprevotia sp. IGB-42]|uniref:DUF2065 domain-containing protein n=1 Tax=Andreprevotia sp. IGB-42 TaxID=2497473 RepID=UPI00135CBF0B|nr:DUF2065 domain-containing protein [Andreprevotia sp. IGB-42]KAF0814319.1 hypothetical protein IGB42_01220 [Andreprevotia sp. IGB-42]